MNRIDAEITQGLVFEWLKDIEGNGEKFQQLEQQGRDGITQKIAFLRDSIEKSIIELEQGRKENENRKLGVHHTILELENLISKNESLFGGYSGWIHSVMEKSTNLQKKGLKELISSLILRETQIKVALSCVNLKERISAVFASSPPLRPASNILLHKQDRNPEFSCSLTLINFVLLTFRSDEHTVTIVLPNNSHKIRRGKLSVRIPSTLP